jgi:hypothetical protein
MTPTDYIEKKERQEKRDAERKEKRKIQEEKVDDSLEKVAEVFWAIQRAYYSVNRENRYNKAVKKLAALWEKEMDRCYLDSCYEHHQDASKPIKDSFSLQYFASERAARMLTDTQFTLGGFSRQGFKREALSMSRSYVDRILWFRYEMHPTDATHQKLNAIGELSILTDIQKAFPEDKKAQYQLEWQEMHIYPVDYEFHYQEGKHTRKRIVCTRITEENEKG